MPNFILQRPSLSTESFLAKRQWDHIAGAVIKSRRIFSRCCVVCWLHGQKAEMGRKHAIRKLQFTHEKGRLSLHENTYVFSRLMHVYTNNVTETYGYERHAYPYEVFGITILQNRRNETIFALWAIHPDDSFTVFPAPRNYIGSPLNLLLLNVSSRAIFYSERRNIVFPFYTT